MLPPTDIYSDIPFMSSLHRVGEGLGWYSSPYEMWSQVRVTPPVLRPAAVAFVKIPLERERLLGLAQRSLNNGKTKVINYI